MTSSEKVLIFRVTKKGIIKINDEEKQELEIAQEYFKWLTDNHSYIRGVFESKGFNKNGGYNGIIDDIEYVLEKEFDEEDHVRFSSCMYSTEVIEAYMRGDSSLEIDITQSEIEESRGN